VFAWLFRRRRSLFPMSPLALTLRALGRPGRHHPKPTTERARAHATYMVMRRPARLGPSEYQIQLGSAPPTSDFIDGLRLRTSHADFTSRLSFWVRSRSTPGFPNSHLRRLDCLRQSLSRIEAQFGRPPFTPRRDRIRRRVGSG